MVMYYKFEARNNLYFKFVNEKGRKIKLQWAPHMKEN